MYLLPSLAIHQVLTSLQVPLTWLGGCFDFSPTGQPHQTKVVAMEKKKVLSVDSQSSDFFSYTFLFFACLGRRIGGIIGSSSHRNDAIFSSPTVVSEVSLVIEP